MAHARVGPLLSLNCRLEGDNRIHRPQRSSKSPPLIQHHAWQGSLTASPVLQIQRRLQDLSWLQMLGLWWWLEDRRWLQSQARTVGPQIQWAQGKAHQQL